MGAEKDVRVVKGRWFLRGSRWFLPEGETEEQEEDEGEAGVIVSMHPVSIDWDDGTKTRPVAVESWEGIFPHHPSWVREGVSVSGPAHRGGEICVGPPLVSICWNDGTHTHNVTDWEGIHP